MRNKLKNLTAGELAVLDGDLTNRQVAEAIGIGVGTVSDWRQSRGHKNTRANQEKSNPTSVDCSGPTRSYLSTPKMETYPQPKYTQKPGDEDTFKGETWEAKRTINRRVTTLAELLDVCGVDGNEWSVERWSCKAWEGFSKDNDGKAVITDTMFSVSATFKRNASLIAAKTDIAEMLAEAKSGLPLYTPAPRRVKANSLRCVILSPENHFGKSCWGEETGEDYDLKIALTLHYDGLHRLMEKIASFDIGRFTFAAGNDLQTSDNSQNTTFAGTPQDVDGRFPKVFTSTRKAMTGTIDLLLETAPVKVIMVAGNHDQDTNYCLGDALGCRYEDHHSVEIDNTPRIRKYDEFGRNLHGFTHGDKQKITDLPLQMAQDVSEQFGRTKWREWFTGHTHGMKLQEIKGIAIRTISSLSPQDSWHNSKGFTHNRRAWEAFLYDPDAGIVASVIDVVQ